MSSFKGFWFFMGCLIAAWVLGRAAGFYDDNALLALSVGVVLFGLLIVGYFNSKHANAPRPDGEREADDPSAWRPTGDAFHDNWRMGDDGKWVSRKTGRKV